MCRKTHPNLPLADSPSFCSQVESIHFRSAVLCSAPGRGQDAEEPGLVPACRHVCQLASPRAGGGGGAPGDGLGVLSGRPGIHHFFFNFFAMGWLLGGLTSAPEAQARVLELRAFPPFSAFCLPHEVQRLPRGLFMNWPLPRGPSQVSAPGGGVWICHLG